MSKILLMQAMRQAWVAYVQKLNRHLQGDRMENYLSQETEMGMKLEEFAEIVFMAGFSAGEKYAGTVSLGGKKYKAKLN